MGLIGGLFRSAIANGGVVPVMAKVGWSVNLAAASGSSDIAACERTPGKDPGAAT
jgi:hypothetical protein